MLITRGRSAAVFPQKLAVGAQLSKLVGWDRPTEVRLEAGTELAAFLANSSPEVNAGRRRSNSAVTGGED